MTQEIARELVMLGLDWIVTSPDAAKGETYAAIRGADLDRTLKNIRGLQRAKQELGSALPTLSIGFVALRSNVAELPAVVRLAAELGAGEVRVHGREPYGEEMAAQIVYAPEAAHFRRLLLAKSARPDRRRCIIVERMSTRARLTTEKTARVTGEPALAYSHF